MHECKVLVSMLIFRGLVYIIKGKQLDTFPNLILYGIHSLKTVIGQGVGVSY